ncbi:methionine biosynthesis protein MetW [Lentisphaerota bacterium ZTH]|nr:methionine biosynthesis protein MetW [Lentisphaerota bacterium]WET06768.1 methionine biosynthesis protein MetW [Lentisphaerota bacterium ZTH]
MVGKLKKELAKRRDLVEITKMIEADTRVLDLGCGNGIFLKLLECEKNVKGLGIEISQQQIIESIATGIPVVHGDLNHDLDFAEDSSFDYVVLSRTLQEVYRPDRLLSEIVRVGKRAIVSFINFGYYKTRLQLLFTGSMPETKNLPYYWYDTPNIHLGTLKDFRRLCRELDIRIIRELPLENRSLLSARILPNLFAPTCIFEICKEN